MKLGYYQPQQNADGVSAGLGALGKTMSDLGQLAIDDKAQKAKIEKDNFTLEMMKNADTRGDAELKLKADELKYKTDASQAKLLQEAIKSKNMASAFRAAHPNATKHLSDSELISWGNDIDKLLPKEAKIDKLDTRITPDGDKILTYMQDGKIVEKNMGKVKTDWNEGKDTPSSEIPAGHIAVDENYFNSQKSPLKMGKTKDGRAYSKIDDFNQWLSEDTKVKTNLKFDKPLSNGDNPEE